MPNLDNMNLLIVSATALLLWTAMRIRRLRRRSRFSDSPSPSPPRPVAEPAPALRLGPLVDNAEIKLHQTFRELHARLENKIQVLNELVAQADASESRLRQQLELMAPARNKGTDSEKSSGDADIGPGRFDEIYALADRGMSPLEIARQVDQPIGEVQLILGLRRRMTG